MRRFACATLVVSTALLGAGCSTEYEMVESEGRESSGTAGEGSPEVAADSPADAPDRAAPGLLAGSEAGAATPREEPVDSPAEGEWAVPAEPGPPATPVAPASDPFISAPPVEPEPVAVEPRPPTTPPPAAYAQPSIQLSAGVALPQSLPTGTTMGFSVDYQFTAGEPGSSPYVWVIKPSKGQTIKQPVQLRARGTLQGFCPPLRPENGPFSTHIENAQGNRLSKSLPLR